MVPKKVCFIGFFPDYETYFFQQVKIEGLDIEVFNPIDITKSIFGFKKLPRFIRNIWHKKLIVTYITKQPNEHFIFNEHRLLLQGICQYLESTNHKFKGYLLLRNPIDDNQKIKPHLKILQKHNTKILTFDKGDSMKYGFEIYPQFASVIPELQNLSTTSDFSFIGRDKGRKEQLTKLKSNIEALGYQTYFDIRQPNDSNLTYLDYLKHSLQARCMVEILQEGQQGMTLRAVETLLYKRKLLTNNQSIVHEPFYHPDKVMVFNGQDIDTSKLELFMNTKNPEMPDSVQQQYLTTEIISSILR